MSLKERIQVVRVQDEPGRQQAMKVLRATYREEKNWVADEQKVFAPADLDDEEVSWFMVSVDGAPVGVLRVLYNPPLELYKEYGFKKIGSGLDVEDFIRRNRIAEIGRFAVLPEYRKFMVVVVALMRAASRETVERNFTHYITDIFEGEKHSPYLFHTRVMGFQPVATHDVGELNCPNRRITMVLDLKAAYNRLRSKQKLVFRGLTEDWPQHLHERLREVPEESSTFPALAALKRAVNL